MPCFGRCKIFCTIFSLAP